MDSRANVLSPTIGKRKLKHFDRSPSNDKAVLLTNKVLAKLNNDSNFFEQNPSVQLPSFQVDEITVGILLGSGQFGEVLEVNNFQIKEKCFCFVSSQIGADHASDGSCHGENQTSHSIDSNIEQSCYLFNFRNLRRFDLTVSIDSSDGGRETLATDDGDEIGDYGDGEDDFSDVFRQDCNEIMTSQANQRRFMKTNTERHGVSRFAVKRLNQNQTEENYAMIDLACEAKFLSSLCHPNIIKIRATVGTVGRPDFMILMDRFHMTVEDKIEEWKEAQRRYRGALGFRRQNKKLRHIMLNRIIALRDIAQAMKYLHGNKIMYRDLKPDNIAFDFGGNIKIFDFGLARELKPKDLVEPPNGYELTGLAGSRRYMAPEVVKCMHYGLSADVYSFAILSWQVFALKTPFGNIDIDKHFDKVVRKGKRPAHRSSGSSSAMQSMMEESWAEDPKRRPAFPKICELLTAEVTAMKNSGNTKRMFFQKSPLMFNRSVESNTIKPAMLN